MFFSSCIAILSTSINFIMLVLQINTLQSEDAAEFTAYMTYSLLPPPPPIYRFFSFSPFSSYFSFYHKKKYADWYTVEKRVQKRGVWQANRLDASQTKHKTVVIFYGEFSRHILCDKCVAITLYTRNYFAHFQFFFLGTYFTFNVIWNFHHYSRVRDCYSMKIRGILGNANFLDFE